jgi:serine/threonine-protein kinase
VAIKVLAVEGEPDVIRRFRSEAATTGNLKHKNIVTVHEFGEHEGMPYLVMEFLEGVTLQRAISNHQDMTLLEKIRIMHEVAEGLAYAHRNTVIHRDIKPANIMLLPGGAAKLMDFGIARVMGRDSTRQTREGFLLGTMLYMSPEQFRGVDADRLTDMFGYGVTYYEFLAGVHPFQSADAAGLLYNITTCTPAPSPITFRAHLPRLKNWCTGRWRRNASFVIRASTNCWWTRRPCWPSYGRCGRTSCSLRSAN